VAWAADEDSLRALAARLPVDQRERWLLVFDFDGTLADIAPRPEDAHLDPDLLAILEPLRDAVGWLVVVSGRDGEQLDRLVPAGWWKVGSYGLELPPELVPSGHPPGFDAAAAEAALQALHPVVSALAAQWPGTEVETKRFGIVLHYRNAPVPPDPSVMRGALQPRLEGSGLVLVSGRRNFEVRPEFHVDKGWVTRFLIDHLDPAAVTFVGDDLGDAPAWEALLDAPDEVATLGLGVASAEVPPGTLTICDAVLPDRAALVTFCRALLESVALGAG